MTLVTSEWAGAAVPFDLGGRSVVFVPSSGGYRINKLPLRSVLPSGPPLDWRKAQGPAGFQYFKTVLPFSFPFGERRWNEMFINHRGNISFGKPEVDSWSQRDPWPSAGMLSVAAAIDSRSSAGMERMIAALWGPHDVVYVHLHTGKDRVIVTWKFSTPPPFASANNVVQASLFPSGEVELSYPSVSTTHGIVGLFPGQAPVPKVLDTVPDGPDSVPGFMDIREVTVEDAGSCLHFTLRLAEPVVTKLDDGDLYYSIRLQLDDEAANIYLHVGKTADSGSAFASDPRPVGFRIEGNRIELSLSKLRLIDVKAASWGACAYYYRASGVRGDDLGDPTKMRPLLWAQPDLQWFHPGPRTPITAHDLKGNLFEVFHRSVYPINAERTLRRIYRMYEDQDDLALIFLDFPVDSLFGGGYSTGAINFPIRGIGPALGKPRSPDEFGSKKLQVSMSPTYIGRPEFAETVSRGEGPIHGYGFALANIVHELVHRWGIEVRSRSGGPAAVQSLGSGTHWIDQLHSPSASQVSSTFSQVSYRESSPMGGQFWREVSPGIFEKSAKPYFFPSGFSQLDLYLMGLLPASEIADTFVLENVVPLTGDRVRATKRVVSIKDVIAAEGLRDPNYSRSQKEFTLGVYLVLGADQQPKNLDRTEAIAGALPDYFSRATGGRMKVVLHHAQARK